jgi:hypothetical protein
LSELSSLSLRALYISRLEDEDDDQYG